MGIAADDRDRSRSQSLMAAELEKRELENKMWMLEEKSRHSETQFTCFTSTQIYLLY